jgi:hypothetical protein
MRSPTYAPPQGVSLIYVNSDRASRGLDTNFVPRLLDRASKDLSRPEKAWVG